MTHVQKPKGRSNPSCFSLRILRRLRISIPRYPYYLQATARDWFQTTVNPLVWDLVKKKRMPVDSMLVPKCHALAKLGINVDTWRWADLHPRQTEPVEEWVKNRPLALFDADLMLEIFSLLVSGRVADARRARSALLNLSARHSGNAPTWGVEEVGSRTKARMLRATWGGSKPKVAGREELCRHLRDQAIVWETSMAHPDASDRQVILKAAASAKISKSQARTHHQALKLYIILLEGAECLRRQAHRRYPLAHLELRRVATLSLKDAIAWLAEPGVQPAT